MTEQEIAAYNQRQAASNAGALIGLALFEMVFVFALNLLRVAFGVAVFSALLAVTVVLPPLGIIGWLYVWYLASQDAE